MLWLDMGLGKTVATLTAYSDLREEFEVAALLVVAPLRICQSVWKQEAQKWHHLRHLRFSLIHGTAAQRMSALKRRADVYLINYENLRWLAAQIKHLWLRKGHYPPFSMVAYDEVTRMKNTTAKRVREWRPVLPYFSRRVGLTGEPAANGYKDLHGQYLVVDGGQRLGSGVTAYREAFLKPLGYGGHGWIVTRTGQEQIHRRIADITLELSAEDYLDLPPVNYNTLWVDLPPQARAIYDRLEHEFFTELDSGAELEVVNEASKINKLAQIASGAAYLTPGGPWEEIHRAKLEALREAFEEASGRPMLLGYTYVHEATRVAREWPEDPAAREGVTFLSSKLGETEVREVLERWMRNEIPVLAGHPASMGHGLNLGGTDARSVIWFSLPWSLELYNQMNARLIGGHRRTGSNTIHHILARDTVDEVIWSALQSKSTTQAHLRKAVEAYRARKQ
jgi:muconolactone delta-isomerase